MTPWNSKVLFPAFFSLDRESIDQCQDNNLDDQNTPGACPGDIGVSLYVRQMCLINVTIYVFNLLGHLWENHAPMQRCKFSYIYPFPLVLHRTDTSLKGLSSLFSWSYFFSVRVHLGVNHLKSPRQRLVPGYRVNRIQHTDTRFRRIPTAFLFLPYHTKTKSFSTSIPSTMPIVTSLTKALGIRVCVSFFGGYWLVLTAMWGWILWGVQSCYSRRDAMVCLDHGL